MTKLVVALVLGSFSLGAVLSDGDKASIRATIVHELAAIRDFSAQKREFYAHEHQAMLLENDPANDFFLEIFQQNERVMKNIFITTEETIRKFDTNEPLWKQKARLQLLRNKLYAYYADSEELRNYAILRRNEGIVAKSFGMLSWLGSMLVKVSSVAVAIKSIYDLWPNAESKPSLEESVVGEPNI